MLDAQTILKIQADVDGELTEPESRRLAKSLEQDPEAPSFRQSLEATCRLVAANEPIATVPMPRAVYWSEIARKIQPAVLPDRRVLPRWLEGWWRALVPASGLAALVLLLWFGAGKSAREAAVSLSVGHEVETPLLETTSFTYRSESELMTVVWVETGAGQSLELIH